MFKYVEKTIDYDKIQNIVQEYFKNKNIDIKLIIKSEIDPEENLGVKTTFHLRGNFSCNRKEMILTLDQIKDILNEYYSEKENKQVLTLVDRAAAINDDGKLGTYENPANKIICEYFSVITKEKKNVYYK